MLSIQNISAGQAAHYFRKENYYSEADAEENSEWFGELAEALNLSEENADADFVCLLNGTAPNGKALTQKKLGTDHRAGIDLTASAPKSVSMAALWGGDDRLIAAHKRANDLALKAIEQHCAQARVWDADQKKQVKQKTGKLLGRRFLHTTSRALDPQLHTHNVILNTTKTADGKWRALSNEEIFQYRTLYDGVYCNALAHEVQAIGYEIEHREDGWFELKGYPPEQLEIFSKRRQQIVSAVGASATAVERQRAALATRSKKEQGISLAELQTYWDGQNEAYRLGIVHPVPNRARVLQNRNEKASIAQVLENAIAHCSERNVAFKSEDLKQFAFSRVQGFSFAAFEQAIAQAHEAGTLIRTIDDRFTTDSAIARELHTIRGMNQGKNQHVPMLDAEVTKAQLAVRSLTEGQRSAIALALTSADQFIAWQGRAGVGKTFALRELTDMISAQNQRVVKGFAPSAEAAKVLGQEVGIDAKTVASLLHSNANPEPTGNELWIVDEAGLLSADAAQKLLDRAIAEGARVILVGDVEQLSSVEAGNPFKSLQAAGIATAYLEQSIRQRQADQALREAIQLVAQNQMEAGFRQLDRSGRIQDFGQEAAQHDQLVQDYLALSPQEQEQTLILSGTNQARAILTEKIRSGLKAQGRLEAAIKTTRLNDKGLTEIQTRYSHYIDVGDFVVPLGEYPKQGMSKGRQYQVVSKDRDTLTLRAESGNLHTVDPMKFRKSVYRPVEMEVAIGDRLRFRKNDRDKERVNGEEFTVVDLQGNQATIRRSHGKLEQLDLSQPNPIDHALVSTIYASQGKTADRALISTDGKMFKENFYVAVSRVKRELKVYTADKSRLLHQVQASNANETARELIPSSLVEPHGQPQSFSTESADLRDFGNRLAERLHAALQSDEGDEYANSTPTSRADGLASTVRADPTDGAAPPRLESGREIGSDSTDAEGHALNPPSQSTRSQAESKSGDDASVSRLGRADASRPARPQRDIYRAQSVEQPDSTHQLEGSTPTVEPDYHRFGVDSNGDDRGRSSLDAKGQLDRARSTEPSTMNEQRRRAEQIAEMKALAYQILDIVGQPEAAGYRCAIVGGYRIEEINGHLHIRDHHHHEVLHGDELCGEGGNAHCRSLRHIATVLYQDYESQERAREAILQEEYER